jgi:rhodanese-related sulfurtransferase
MRHFLLVVTCIISSAGFAQYKNDNVKYKTIFLEDFCETLKNNRDYVFLDVRSKGEYADTSSTSYLNIGRLKNAINISVDELPGRLAEIKQYSDKPVVVYCSHSQRSRRASAMLADSGFTNVMNLNGGLTFFNQFKETTLPCSNLYYETANNYTLIAAPGLLSKLKSGTDIFLLDIRKDSVFKGISNDEALNANGKIKGAVNIPLTDLPGRLSELPASKPIVIIDDGGNESPKAAKILSDNGFKNISLAFNGMNMWNATSLGEMKGKEKFWSSPFAFKMITADDFNVLARTPGSIIIDVRSEEEYANKAKENWRNRGNIKGARSIPFNSFASRFKELDVYKNKPVFLYHFNNQPDVFKAARILTENGYTNVNVLIGGIWNLSWRAANIKNKKDISNWVENIPPENL